MGEQGSGTGWEVGEKKGCSAGRRMSHHASAHEAAAAAAEASKTAHPLGVGAAREEGSGNAESNIYEYITIL